MNIIKNHQIEGLHGRPILLDVYLEKTGTAKPIVIFSHGFKGFKDWGHFTLVAKTFAKAGFVFVKFNFSHNGTTPDKPLDFSDLEAFGRNNYSIELDDLGCVIDWISGDEHGLEQAEIKSDAIHLIGHSRGGGTTILKAAEDERVQKIATWASIDHNARNWSEGLLERWRTEGVIHILNGRTKQQMPLYWQLAENYFANVDRLNIEQAARKLTTPMLIAHGTADPAVRFESAERLHKWHTMSQLLRIEGGDHVFGARHPWTNDSLPSDAAKVVQASIDFFNNSNNI